jgi:CDP-diacylglycerol--serine O-phosphatidyltransferase
MIKLVEFHLDHLKDEFLQLTTVLGKAIFFSAILYAMCAVVRLARFNVENDEDESAHMNFSGLPSPAAAGVIVSLVVLHQQFLHSIADWKSAAFHTFEIITVIALPVITLLTGILMVSRIRYPHLANQLLRGKKPPATILIIFASGLLIVWNIQLAMVLGFCGFALFGISRWIVVSLSRKRRPKPEPSGGDKSPGI